MSVTAGVMTTEDLLALPEDGIDRDLIRGQVRESPMTKRNRRHTRTTTKLARFLEVWLSQLPAPRGEILTGEAAFRLRSQPDTTVGTDIAFISGDLAERSPDNAFLLEGAPILAVEILSPSDTHERVVEKIQEYLDAGTALVWIVDPDLRTVTVHRPGEEPQLFNAKQVIGDEPILPGLRLAIADLFDF